MLRKLLFAWLFCSFAFLVEGQEDMGYRIRMQWLPQAEFAGFYMARDAGLYEKAGVKVSITYPKIDEELFDTLRTNGTDMILAWPISALERVVAGDDIVNICQIAQRSSLMLLGRKDSDIHTVEDISGHNVGLWVTPSLSVPLQAYLSHYKVTDYKVLPVLTSVDLFLYGGVDVICGVYYDEYYRIYGSGYNHDEILCFYLRDTFPNLGDGGVYCKRETWLRDPEACMKIREATIAGWRLAQKNPKRALELVNLECAKCEVFYDVAHQRWMLNVMLQDIFPENLPNNEGVLRKETFDQLVEIVGEKAKSISYEQFFPGIATVPHGNKGGTR